MFDVFSGPSKVYSKVQCFFHISKLLHLTCVAKVRAKREVFHPLDPSGRIHSTLLSTFRIVCYSPRNLKQADLLMPTDHCCTSVTPLAIPLRFNQRDGPSTQRWVTSRYLSDLAFEFIQRFVQRLTRWMAAEGVLSTLVFEVQIYVVGWFLTPYSSLKFYIFKEKFFVPSRNRTRYHLRSSNRPAILTTRKSWFPN